MDFNYITPELIEKAKKYLDIDPFSQSILTLNEVYVEPCVYFLFHENEIVYIGKTTNIYVRLEYHRKTNKKFDSYQRITVSMSELDFAERILINKYLPKYNRDNITKKLRGEK